MLVVRRDSDIRSVEDLEDGKISTKLVNFTRQLLAERNINVSVDFSWDATEARAVKGLADAAVENNRDRKPYLSPWTQVSSVVSWKPIPFL